MAPDQDDCPDLPGYISYEVDEIFDIINEGKQLQERLDAQISQLFVEFLNYGDVLPHVIFRMTFTRPVTGFHGAQLSLDLDGRVEDAVDGRFTLKFLKYLGRSHGASASFQFNWNGFSKDGYAVTLGDVLELLRGSGEKYGLNPQLNTDITVFDFTMVDGPSRHVDGCRDWLSQAFVRMNYVGWVGWKIVSITKAAEVRGGTRIPEEIPSQRPGEAVETRIDWSTAGFHDIIGKQFLPGNVVVRGGVEKREVLYHECKMENGLFHVPNTVRAPCGLAITSLQFELPYRELPPFTPLLQYYSRLLLTFQD